MVTPPQSRVQKLGLQMCFYAGIIFCCDSNFVGEKKKNRYNLQVVIRVNNAKVLISLYKSE